MGLIAMFRFQPPRSRHERGQALRGVLNVGSLAVTLVATGALAQSADLAAGGQALQRGDNVEAVRLLSRALASPGLTPDERERALVQRGQAFLANSDAADAYDDARQALVINPNDDRAAGVRQKAQIALIARRPVGQPDPSQAAAVFGLNSKSASQSAQTAAETAANAKAFQAAEENYHQNLTQYQADRKAEQDSYATAQADYQAKLKAAEEKRQADLAAWQACQKGDRSKCAPKPK
ncbi:MAG TPA: hypothetical protein VK801_01345 [Caulobacteraceae bacterium]|jgi:hypothetical protein|nr:hypothetical protein [Caulobacteraceae bacterium]